jgi:diguanylate cyclase (GGDEF)-like protein
MKVHLPDGTTRITVLDVGQGDAILIEFSRRVNSVLREVDTFARYGGEEFIGLLSETDLQGALTTAEKINELINKAS